VFKFNLNDVLPKSSLNELIPAFEAIYGVQNAVAILAMDQQLYYGLQPDGHICTVTDTLICIDNQDVARIGLYIETPDERLLSGVKYLGLTLSHIATETWRRQKLSEEVLERYDELNLIYNLGLSFIQGVAQDEIFKDVLDKAHGITQADSGAIYAWNPGISNVTPITYFGDNATPEFWDGRIRELALSTLYAYEEPQLFDSEKMICAPLRYNEELLGALVLVYEHEEETFKANDVNLLSTLSNNTALFVHAARLRDKLEQRRAELEQTLSELQTTKDKLSQAERLSLIGQTLGGLVHDMRKPLNVVMGYAGLLQEPDLTQDERHQFADQIIKYVDTFSAMMQEILDYTSDNANVQKQPVKVGTYMTHIHDLLMPPGLERPVKIAINTDSAQDYIINIDSQRFSRVFQNLVNNAIDAIESKGGSKIDIDVVPEDDVIRFSITDDGPGVPEKIINTLFEPFVTLDKPSGTGLGLAIVDRMVSIHGGKIHYESAPDHGARFVFTVPKASGKNP
jgi:signal transduction histidine kinase